MKRFQPNFSPAVWAERLMSLPVAFRVLSGLAALVLIGALLFMLPGMSTRPLEFNEALFTSASALTVTGLTVITPGVDLTFMGQVLLLVLIQVGGIGLMIFTVVIFRLLGRTISLVDRQALRNSFGNIMPGAVARLGTQVMIAVLIIEAVGALLLYLHWRPTMSDQMAVWYAIFHSVSALCNSGFDLFGGLPGYTTIPNDGFTLTVFGVLIFIGSLGVPVAADLLAFPRNRRLTLHSRLTLPFITFMVLSTTLVIFASEALHPGILSGEPWDRRLGLALFQSVSARTAGFIAVPTFDQLAPASQLMLMAVMFIGAAPASMGGGVTTGTAVALLIALWSYIRNRPYPEAYGRTISTITVRRATAVLTISLILVIVATISILLSDPQIPLDSSLFEVVSAFATCGLTLAYTPQLNVFSRIVIILVMMWGRLGALTVMVALTRPMKDPLFYYPEEKIMIG
jgi:trk system potassium uptake protein